MLTMYPGMVNSPVTTLANSIDDTQTVITVNSINSLPSAPNIATIGTDENAETILYTGKSGNDLTGVTRGFEGTAKSWPAETSIARLFTNYDWKAIRENFNEHVADIVTDGVHGMGAIASETYEEGTWTPEFAGDTDAGTDWAYRDQTGVYRRVGNLVFCSFQVLLSAVATDASGNLKVTGFPFTRANTNTPFPGLTYSHNSVMPIPADLQEYRSRMRDNYLEIIYLDTNGLKQHITISQLNDTTRIGGHIVYEL